MLTETKFKVLYDLFFFCVICSTVAALTSVLFSLFWACFSSSVSFTSADSLQVSVIPRLRLLFRYVLLFTTALYFNNTNICCAHKWEMLMQRNQQHSLLWEVSEYYKQCLKIYYKAWLYGISGGIGVIWRHKRILEAHPIRESVSGSA